MMGRKISASAARGTDPERARWRLRDAQARFGELVRLATREGPQLVTVRGRDVVVIINANDFKRLQGRQSGQLLIDALRACPSPQLPIEVVRSAMPIRTLEG